MSKKSIIDLKVLVSDLDLLLVVNLELYSDELYLYVNDEFIM